MEQGKELIYKGEEVETIPPIMEEPPRTAGETSEPARRKRSGWFAGLTVGIALFAAAFLLCDGAHALQLSAEEIASATDGDEERGNWLAQLLAGSFVGGQSGTILPQVTDRVPDDENLSAGTTSAASLPFVPSAEATVTTSAVAPSEPEKPKPMLTPEELYAFAADAVPQGMIPIVPMDLSLSGYGESFHYNDTGYTLSLKDLPADSRAIPTIAGAGEVSVLILHTHATEGYSGEGATYYDPSTPLARADDPATGVVAVGDVIADILNQNGIKAVHSTVLHDLESYKDSYSRAAQTVKAYLAQYPSIRLVIDVHRDSIMTSGEQLIRPVTVVDGEATAQVMCVVGSDAAGAVYEDWQKNLSLAVRLRNALNADYGNLCRPVYIKKSTYNQQYAPASLLLEIGSSGNTLAEAQRAAELVANKIVEMMK